MAMVCKLFRHCIEAMAEAGGDFFVQFDFLVPAHIISEFGENLLKINCFITFLLKNCQRGQNTVRTPCAFPGSVVFLHC